MKLYKWLDEHFEETLLIILLVVISFVSLAQVVVRKLPWIPALTWAEEFCRFCWIWSVFLSLPYTIRAASMLRVSVVMDLLPETLRKIWNLIVDLIITASMLLLGVYSISVISGIYQSGETSPAMLWPMWIIYSIMLVGFFLATLRGLQQFVRHILGFRQHELTTTEATMEEAKAEARQVTGGEV